MTVYETAITALEKSLEDEKYEFGFQEKLRHGNINKFERNEHDCYLERLTTAIESLKDEATKTHVLEARIKELEETTLLKDEASALYSAVGDVDLWNTEDEEYTSLIRSAVNKLWKMKKEVV